MHPNDTLACFHHHLGIWAYEPMKFQQAVWLFQQGRYREQLMAFDQVQEREAALPTDQPRFTRATGGVALIRITGAMGKGYSKVTETSTIAVRQAIRQAVADEHIQALLLAIDSPGGMVAGTAELAAEVAKAKQQRPVMAYIEDLGASAAYWVASQADQITANASAEVGSIGVLAVVQDSSGLAEREGITVHVISTGPYKGAGVGGTPILPAHLADLQARVDAVAAHFFTDVQGGRGLSKAQMAVVTDGRVFPAAQAQTLGLIDGIQTFDDALAAAAAMPAQQRTTRRRAAVAAARLTWERL